MNDRTGSDRGGPGASGRRAGVALAGLLALAAAGVAVPAAAAAAGQAPVKPPPIVAYSSPT